MYSPFKWYNMFMKYSIVKDRSADLGVNSKIVQIRPTVKAVSTKISKKLPWIIYLQVKAGKWHNSIKVVPADVSLNMNGKKVGRIPALCSISAVELE